MSDLDARLGKLLEQRREKKRFRALKEYDTGGQSGLIDFVSKGRGTITEAGLSMTSKHASDCCAAPKRSPDTTRSELTS